MGCLDRLTRGSQVRIEWNEDGLRELGNQVARDHAARVQAVLDKVLDTGAGNSVDEVKALLLREVRSTLGGDITDPELTTYAEALAAGQRIDVKPQFR
jgi:hypothetical protein